MSFIPKEWIGDAGTPYRGEVDAVKDETLVTPGRIVEEAPVGADRA
jgi:hypothetical protein